MTEKQLITLTHSEGYEPIRDIELILNKSTRATRISIKPNIDKHSITITFPARGLFAKSQAMTFLKTKENWLYQIFATNSRKHKDEITFGGTITFFGRKLRLEQSKIRATTYIEEGVLYLSCPSPEFIERRFHKFCKEQLEIYIKSRCKFYAEKLDESYEKISIKQVSTRWGSCTSTGNLAFAFKLYKYEPWVIDYVVAHEISHLREMNHSEKFWNLVKAIYEHNVLSAKRVLKG